MHACGLAGAPGAASRPPRAQPPAHTPGRVRCTFALEHSSRDPAVCDLHFSDFAIAFGTTAALSDFSSRARSLSPRPRLLPRHVPRIRVAARRALALLQHRFTCQARGTSSGPPPLDTPPHGQVHKVQPWRFRLQPCPARRYSGSVAPTMTPPSLYIPPLYRPPLYRPPLYRPSSAILRYSSKAFGSCSAPTFLGSLPAKRSRTASSTFLPERV